MVGLTVSLLGVNDSLLGVDIFALGQGAKSQFVEFNFRAAVTNIEHGIEMSKVPKLFAVKLEVIGNF